MRPYLFSNRRAPAAHRATLVPADGLRGSSPCTVRVATTDLTTGLPATSDGRVPARPAVRSAALPGCSRRSTSAPSTRPRRRGRRRRWTLQFSAWWTWRLAGDRVWVLDVTKRPRRARKLRTPVDVLGGGGSRLEQGHQPAGRAARRRGRAGAALKLDEEFDCGPVFDFGDTAG